MRRLERGEGRVGTVIGLILVIFVAMSLFDFVPKKIATVKLGDFCMEQARHGGKNERKIRKRIYDVAQELRLPVEHEDITVKVSHKILIQVDYTVPIKIPLMGDRDWQVSHHVDELKITF